MTDRQTSHGEVLGDQPFMVRLHLTEKVGGEHVQGQEAPGQEMTSRHLPHEAAMAGTPAPPAKLYCPCGNVDAERGHHAQVESEQWVGPCPTVSHV